MYLVTVDLNECSERFSGCEQLCNNTDGSYQCGCREGYTLNTDGMTCDGRPICSYVLNYTKSNNTVNNSIFILHVCIYGVDTHAMLYIPLCICNGVLMYATHLITSIHYIYIHSLIFHHRC